MEILLGLAAASALLYFWLVRHWFARVLVFLGMAVLLAWAGSEIGSRIAPLPTISAATSHVPDYMTSTAPDYDAHGIPTDEGLLRRMHRIAPPPQVEARASTKKEFIAAGYAQEDAEFLARTGAGLPVKQPDATIWPVLIGSIAGIGLAWLLSGIPIYAQRRSS